MQGRGKKPARDVILEEIDQIRKNPEAVKNIRKRCEEVAQEAQGKHEVGQSPKHKSEIQLPAGDWGEACQRVGRIDGNPVRTGQLLAALILESESWQQVGNAGGEFNAGWNEDSLISSLTSLTATTAGLSLGRQEKIIAWIVVAAAVVAATAAVASAIAAWVQPMSKDELKPIGEIVKDALSGRPGPNSSLDGRVF